MIPSVDGLRLVPVGDEAILPADKANVAVLGDDDGQGVVEFIAQAEG